MRPTDEELEDPAEVGKVGCLLPEIEDAPEESTPDDAE